MNTNRILISGDHGSAGKTTITLGLARIFRDAGLPTQVFKKGPDFIDPLWHSAASGKPCRNLDFFMMPDFILPTFHKHAVPDGINLIEGNKGLFDGIDTGGRDSSSALARLLSAPVLLVVDTKRMTRGVAALVHGYLHFEKDLEIAGIILNNVAGERHEGKLLAAVEKYCDVEVFGVVRRNRELLIDERHLGLVPSAEVEKSEKKISTIARIIKESVDTDRIYSAAVRAMSLDLQREKMVLKAPVPDVSAGGAKKLRLAVAKDQAFTFYYPENFEALEQKGVELLFFSPQTDDLPEADGMLFGGGFPELYPEQLSANTVLLEKIRQNIESGMPSYAECGGLMYLSRFIRTGGRDWPMAGVLPFGVEMTSRPVGRGYMVIKPYEGCDLDTGEPAKEIFCHEFHHSKPVWDKNEGKNHSYCYEVRRGTGIDGKSDGIRIHGLLASYAHIHYNSSPLWVDFLVKSMLNYQIRSGLE